MPVFHNLGEWRGLVRFEKNSAPDDAEPVEEIATFILENYFRKYSDRKWNLDQDEPWNVRPDRIPGRPAAFAGIKPAKALVVRPDHGGGRIHLIAIAEPRSMSLETCKNTIHEHMWARHGHDTFTNHRYWAVVFNGMKVSCYKYDNRGDPDISEATINNTTTHAEFDMAEEAGRQGLHDFMTHMVDNASH